MGSSGDWGRWGKSRPEVHDRGRGLMCEGWLDRTRQSPSYPEGSGPGRPSTSPQGLLSILPWVPSSPLPPSSVRLLPPYSDPDRKTTFPGTFLTKGLSFWTVERISPQGPTKGSDKTETVTLDREGVRLRVEGINTWTFSN